MVSAPTANAEDYELAEDEPTATPKHGTSIQSGWGAAETALKRKGEGEYPNDFRFTEEPQLVRFLDDAPFAVYGQHWIEREGKKSFVCLGDDCPLCITAGDKPRNKFAFNVLVVSDEDPGVQILTAPPTFARQLRAANDDERRGPLTKFYWAISRQGVGPQTTYTLERVRATDLAEEWGMDSEPLDVLAADAVKYDDSSVYLTPREELLKVARSLVNS